VKLLECLLGNEQRLNVWLSNIIEVPPCDVSKRISGIEVIDLLFFD